MFKRKDYYLSTLSIKNKYYIEGLIKNKSFYEEWYSVKDDNNNEYILLFEKVGNKIPNIQQLYFNLPYHESVFFPIDIVVKETDFYHENKIGYIYKKDIMNYTAVENITNFTKKDKINFVKKMKQLLQSIHQTFYLKGLDIRQIYTENNKLYIRYDGFENHNRNSIYKIADIYASQYELYMLDYYSLIVILFEMMYEWHPYYGNATGFTKEEESLFNVYFQNPVFIFDTENKTNTIGFLREQRKIVERWNDTADNVKQIYIDILTFKGIKKYTEADMENSIDRIIQYYEQSDLFQ